MTWFGWLLCPELPEEADPTIFHRCSPIYQLHSPQDPENLGGGGAESSYQDGPGSSERFRFSVEFIKPLVRKSVNLILEPHFGDLGVRKNKSYLSHESTRFGIIRGFSRKSVHVSPSLPREGPINNDFDIQPFPGQSSKSVCV